MIAAGLDYQGVINQVLDIGTSTFNFGVQLIDDAIDEQAETFTLGLTPGSGAVLASAQTATVTILDNDRKPI